MKKKSLEGRVALVTGASRGIGRTVALALSEAGASVAINYRLAADAANELDTHIRGRGGRSIVVRADVSLPEEVARLAETVRKDLGEVDVLVNNAGINPPRGIAEITTEDWQHVLATNLTSAFLLSQAVLPGMRRRGWGRIIMLSSVAAQTGGVIGPHYAASKAGLHGLAHSYATLLAKEGITANVVAPALIETDMIAGMPHIGPELVPAGRFGQASEVADAVLLLATNGYITGQTLNVNGGWYMS